MKAAAGSVGVHAPTMLPATPQRTADRRLAAPEPMIEPEITWVAESGYPAPLLCKHEVTGSNPAGFTN